MSDHSSDNFVGLCARLPNAGDICCLHWCFDEQRLFNRRHPTREFDLNDVSSIKIVSRDERDRDGRDFASFRQTKSENGSNKLTGCGAQRKRTLPVEIAGHLQYSEIKQGDVMYARDCRPWKRSNEAIAAD